MICFSSLNFDSNKTSQEFKANTTHRVNAGVMAGVMCEVIFLRYENFNCLEKSLKLNAPSNIFR